jgi:hypothetical protein
VPARRAAVRPRLRRRGAARGSGGCGPLEFAVAGPGPGPPGRIPAHGFDQRMPPGLCVQDASALRAASRSAAAASRTGGDAERVGVGLGNLKGDHDVGDGLARGPRRAAAGASLSLRLVTLTATRTGPREGPGPVAGVPGAG